MEVAERARTDTGCPFVGKLGRLEPSGTDSVTDPSVLQFDLVDFQELRSTALWDVGDRWELWAPKWSSYGSCPSSEIPSVEAEFAMEQATHTLIIFSVLYNSGSVLNSSGVSGRCPVLSLTLFRGSRWRFRRVDSDRASFVQFYASGGLD